MLKTIASLLLIFVASQSTAQNCPEFFRFVDFGLDAPDGVTYRGGPIFRAESLGGTPLLLRKRTICLAVQDISEDGHGNPIPVVTRIFYDPEKTNIALRELRIDLTGDSKTAAEQNASAHRAALERSDTDITRGTSFLCAQSHGTGTISCQFESPYRGNTPLVVYCDVSQCSMPVLAINSRVSAAATWTSEGANLADPKEVARAISNKIQQIHDFIEPLT